MTAPAFDLDLPRRAVRAHHAAAGMTHAVVQSDLFGALTVPEESRVTFPAGLFGMSEYRAFVLLPSGQSSLFWLQSSEHPAVAFLLADPFEAAPGYAVDLSPADERALGVCGAEDVAILAMVTIRRGGEPSTINLQGPIAINLRTRTGRQLALADATRGVRVPFVLPGAS